MKRTMKWGMGLAAVAGIAVGILAGKFGDFGFGTGSGAGEGDAVRVGLPEDTPAPTRPEDAPREHDPADATAKVEPTEQLPADPPDLVRAVVEINGYSIKETAGGETRYRPVTLDDLVALAARTPGGGNRVRVEITTRPQAPYPALLLLHERLIAAGLQRGEIEGADEVRLEPAGDGTGSLRRD